MKRIILLIVFCLALTINIFGQAKEITEDESVQELVKAFGKFSETSWRKKQKTEFYKKGKLSNTRIIIEEFIKPDRRRIVTIENNGKIFKQSEIIAIGENYYCKEGKKAWKKSDNWCGETKYFIASNGERISSKYTVEKSVIYDQNAKFYRQNITYNDEKIGLYYWDYTFWISDAGFILRRDIVTRLVKTKEIFSLMIEVSEYNPNDLKIEAPIK